MSEDAATVVKVVKLDDLEECNGDVCSLQVTLVVKE